MLLELGDKLAWSQQGYFNRFAPYWDFKDNVDRIDESKVSSSEFIERYEKIYKPVIIQGVQSDWKARNKWTIEVRVYQFI